MTDGDRLEEFIKVYDEWIAAILAVRAKHDAKREELTDAMDQRMRARREDPAAVVTDTMEQRDKLDKEETAERRNLDAEFKSTLEGMREIS